MFHRELKKGSAELLILSLVEDQPRHGYDLCQLIQRRLDGALRFKAASLYPLLYRLERPRLDQRADGSRVADAAGATTASRPRGARSSRRSARDGKRSSMPFAASREPNMPDWREHVRQALGRRRDCRRAEEIVAELVQHLDDRYRQSLADGASEDEARARRSTN